MLILPKSLAIERNEQAEKALVTKTKVWLEKGNENRDTRIHASDLLDPLKAYWNRQHKEELDDVMVGNFFVGKVLHAFFETALAGKKGTSLAETDVGGTWDKSLGITYANDFQNEAGTIPGELKTSRAMNEQTVKDLSAYCEQLCIYMACKKSLQGRLVVLRLTAKNLKKGYGTYPQYRAYAVSWSKAGLLAYRTSIKATVALLTKALKNKSPKGLPLCREWKCGKGNCGHWELCKPKGRYGLTKWTA